jgi:Ca2+-binding RTX toxin-like protein
MPNLPPNSLALDNLLIQEGVGPFLIGNLSAVDPESDPIVWSVTNPGFSVVGNQLFVAAGTLVDYEATPTLGVTVYASDGVNPLVSTALTLQVANVVGSYGVTTSTPSQFENNSGSTDYTFTITRSGDTFGASTVHWAVAGNGGNPANAADFVGGSLPSGNVTFANGETSKDITLSVAGDSHVESNEQFKVSLSGATDSAPVYSAPAVATILNDDAGFSINNASVTEGDSGTQYITFTITRSGYLVNPDTVHWTFQNDAYVPVDTTDFPSQLYAADLPNPPAVKDGYPIFGYLDGNAAALVLRDTDTISFAAGETSHTLTFEVSGDTWLEANDLFHILLTTPSLGSEIIAGQGDGTGTIGNNDQVGTVGYKGTITGSGGNDSLTAPQQLNGYEFFGGPGNDTLIGYGYDNLVYGADGADSIYGGDGHSMVDGGAGDDRIRMHGYIDTVYGGTGNDSIFGTEGTALIDAGWGEDTVQAAGNSNLILGNYGNDSIFGGDHDNTIYGGIGGDTITTTDQRNVIYGDDDQLRRVGFNYADSINGGDHDNTVFGGFGDDTISFVGQRNVAYGMDDNDLITAGSGYDSAYGGDGNDTVNLSGWGNFVDGGNGTDLVNEPGPRSLAAFKYVAGSWFVKFGYNAGSDQLINVETLHFNGGGANIDLSPAAVAAGMVMQGDQVGNDSLLGLGGNDTLTTFGYNNTIDGGSGNDSIDAGRGNASISGGDGSDVIIVSGHSNVIYAGTGDDLVTLRNDNGSNHNNYIDLGDGNNTVSGGVDVNTIIGGSGHDEITVSGHNNLIQSGGGNDAISIGGGGQDTVDGGGGFDVVTFNFARQGAEIVSNADGSFDVHGPNGWDHLVNIEQAVFTDGLSNLGRGAHGDVNGDRLGDGIVQNGSAVYLVQNNYPGAFTIASIGTAGSFVAKDSADLNGDGNADIVFQNPGSTQVYGWLMNGATIAGQGSIGVAGANWDLKFAADLTGDAQADLIFRNSSTGDIYAWLQHGLTKYNEGTLGSPGLGWSLDGAGDFNGDGRSDLLFHNTTTGMVWMWEMNGLNIIAQGGIGLDDTVWQERGIGDFNGDGTSDILWRNSSDGSLYLWEMQGFNIKGQGLIWSPGLGVDVAGVEDLTGDGRADIILKDAAGSYTAVAMDGLTPLGTLVLGSPGVGWHLV